MAAIDELHDLTQLANGAPIVLQREPVDLVAFVRAIVQANPRSQTGQLDFEHAVDHLAVDADKPRMARVVQNLLENATKYSAPDRPVTIAVERQDVDGVAWATIRVQDHGIGIAPDDLPHIFDVYYRGSNAAPITGDGLGLASVRHIVRLHGGHVEVASQVGAGSTFTVGLPTRVDDVVTASA